MPHRPVLRLFAAFLPLIVAVCAGWASLALLAQTALAQPADSGPVKIRAVPQFAAASAGGRLVIAIELDHGDKFHTWPAKGVKLPVSAEVDENLIRTEIALPKGADDKPSLLPTWLASFDGVQYPEARTGKVADPSGSPSPLEVPLYSHKAVAYLRFNIAANAPVGDQSTDVVVSYQACDDKVCTMPRDVMIPVKVRISAPGSPDQTKPNEPSLFEKFDAKQWGASPSTPTPPQSTTKPPPRIVSSSSEDRHASASLFGFNLGTNIFVLALAAALGGLVLNLTPCVLPVIPIKVLTLTQHASSKAHALTLGLWMAFGVVAFWGAIGIPMAFISAGLDPSQFIFGIWWITLGIGLVIAIMGLGIMGLFTINLPQAVYAVDAKADKPFGSFLFGVLTGVLGLPCFGFVAAGLLAAAATLPAYAIMTIFVGMGVGMASPYLVLSVYPNLLKFIPRTGPASELVKQVMGILLLAAAAFFATAGIQSLLKERPYLSGSMTWWAVGFFVALAGLWMTIRTFQIAKTIVPRLFIPILAVAMTLGIGLFAQGELTKDRAAYAERQQAMGSLGSGSIPRTIPAGVWLDYTPELLAAVRASGRPVFLDFTADWCITCKALKAALLDREPLKSLFKARDVVLMTVDCTVRNSAGSKLLNELGRTGVPQWAIYGPAAEKPVFVRLETPTSTTVIEALDAAGVPTTATAATAPVSGSAPH